MSATYLESNENDKRSREQPMQDNTLLSSNTKTKRQKMKQMDAHTNMYHEHQSQSIQHTRDKGLSLPIPSSNIGFKMLSRMGCNSKYYPLINLLLVIPGQSLDGSINGLRNPLPINVKLNRLGIGSNQGVVLDPLDSYRDYTHSSSTKNLFNIPQDKVETYQSSLKDAQLSKQTLKDIERLLKIVVQLNEDNGVTITLDDIHAIHNDTSDTSTTTRKRMNEPMFISFETSHDTEKVRILNRFLRKQYQYCVWCGCRFNDMHDMMESCPGVTFDDHE